MASLFGHLAALTLVATLTSPLGAATASAETVDLFAPVTPAASAAASVAPAPALGAAAVRSRLVSLNVAALGLDVPASPGARRADVRISLFPGVDATFSPAGVEQSFEDAMVWRGIADGGEATLVVRDGKLTGRVRLKGRVYRIAPAGGKLHSVSALDRRRLPEFGPSLEGPSVETPPAPAAPANAAGAQSPDPVVITALFVYTERTKAASQNILLDSLMSAEIANDAFRASGVRVRLKPVGLVGVEDYDEFDHTFGQILDDLATPSPEFAHVHRMRDKKGADLVIMLREDGEFCGQAQINMPPAGQSHRAFSESRRDCIEFNVVSHEVGHNIGLYHDRFVSEKAPKKQYNFGYVDTVNGYQDIMAYADKCASKDMDCEELAAFSNPNVTYHGRPFGVPKGGAGAADGARWLNEHAADVAAFRPDVPVSTAGAKD